MIWSTTDRSNISDKQDRSDNTDTASQFSTDAKQSLLYLKVNTGKKGIRCLVGVLWQWRRECSYILGGTAARTTRRRDYPKRCGLREPHSVERHQGRLPLSRYNRYKSISNRYRRCAKQWLRTAEIRIRIEKERKSNLLCYASATYLQSNIQWLI